MTGPTDAQLRALVAEVVRETVQAAGPTGRRATGPGGASGAGGSSGSGGPDLSAGSDGWSPDAPWERHVTRDGPRSRTQRVRLRSDEDLAGFVRTLLTLFENPKTRADLRHGWLRFRLDDSAAAVLHDPARVRYHGPTDPCVLRIESGAVTERRIEQAAREGRGVRLARGAVLTPLARDKARALGVPIEKER